MGMKSIGKTQRFLTSRSIFVAKLFILILGMEEIRNMRLNVKFILFINLMLILGKNVCHPFFHLVSSLDKSREPNTAARGRSEVGFRWLLNVSIWKSKILEIIALVVAN